MEKRFLQITVKVPVLGDKGEFIYRPAQGKDITDYQLGEVVRVPFGRQGDVKGYLTGFAAEADLAEEKIKEVKGKVSKQPVIRASLLKALRRLKDYYSVSLLSLLQAALPQGADKGGKKSKKLVAYSLTLDSAETQKKWAELKNKAPAQQRVLQTLQKADRDYLTAKELVKRANTSRQVLYALEDKKLLQRKKIKVRRRPAYRLFAGESSPADKADYAEAKGNKNRDITLNDHQREAVEEVKTSLSQGDNPIYLLHGVTGSGKTEVYLRLLKKVLAEDKSALLLVPEISLTPYLVDFFYAHFPGELALLHSSLSQGERLDEWERIREGRAKLVIGARSAVFAPVQDLGIIVIDEEHESTYKQNNYPYYHARGVAVVRSQVEKFPVVLGSATPSLESYYFAQQGHYRYLSLPERAGVGQKPTKKIVDMRQEMQEGNYGLLSQTLKEKINDRLEAGEQILLFLNRRGYASFILCQYCGETIKCQDCDITLTYHRREERLRCHYCDYKEQVPEKCPHCSSKILQDFGAGTERLEDAVNDLFPQANVMRMDVDTTGRKNSHQRILKKVDSGEVDILLGTQMIAKGHDFHNITLVGVLGTDFLLNFPDFRSAERTFQLISQVSGRAGRGKKRGEVVIQTYNPDNFVFQAIKDNKLTEFYQQELKLRQKLFYPPVSRLVRILLRSSDEDVLITVTDKINRELQKVDWGKVKILGPAPSPLSKIRGEYRWQLLLFFPNTATRLKYLPKIKQAITDSLESKVEILVDVDPTSML